MSVKKFEFDLEVFRESAVKLAIYKFSGEFNIQIERPEPSIFCVSLERKSSAPFSHLDPDDLPNEVLDQELREVVAERTSTLRDILLAQAFSGLSLTDAEGETGDLETDGLGIARSALANNSDDRTA